MTALNSASGAPAARLPLCRPGRQLTFLSPQGKPCRGRYLAGVCGALAIHLRQPVGRVRGAMLALALCNGAGVVLYALLWLLVPPGNPWEQASAAAPYRGRLAARLEKAGSQGRRLSPRAQALWGGGALVVAAGLMLLWRNGNLPQNQKLFPLLVLCAGAALAWSQVRSVTGANRDRAAVARLAGGVVLTAVGILLWIGADIPVHMLFTGVLTGVALAVGIGLVLAPVWLAANQEVTRARAEQARAAERADIAAHLHDSVLQTLTLIRKRAEEPEEVARLARWQERELRAWLYTDRVPAGTSSAQAVRALVGEMEDRYGLEIELVIVGDRHPDAASAVVVAAAREALSNAVRHGLPPVSVYAEISADGMEVFVKDKGAGFDLANIAPDRHGVRQSILERLRRHGGTASIRRLSPGTEVHLLLQSQAYVPDGQAELAVPVSLET